MNETTERSAYDKLLPQRKQLVDMLVANLDSGGLWKQGWRTRGAPENAVTGKKYRGVNNLYLFLVAMERGYSDNRTVFCVLRLIAAFRRTVKIKSKVTTRRLPITRKPS